jgi:hypothetical protein
MSFASDSHIWRPVGSRRQRRRLKSTHIRVKASTAFADEAVDPRRNNGQRHRAKLEHGIVERADVEFETRSFPKLPVATLATLPFYVADPSSSIETRSLPSLARRYPCAFTFYVADPSSSILQITFRAEYSDRAIS